MEVMVEVKRRECQFQGRLARILLRVIPPFPSSFYRRNRVTSVESRLATTPYQVNANQNLENLLLLSGNNVHPILQPGKANSSGIIT